MGSSENPMPKRVAATLRLRTRPSSFTFANLAIHFPHRASTYPAPGGKASPRKGPGLGDRKLMPSYRGQRNYRARSTREPVCTHHILYPTQAGRGAEVVEKIVGAQRLPSVNTRTRASVSATSKWARTWITAEHQTGEEKNEVAEGGRGGKRPPPEKTLLGSAQSGVLSFFSES